MPRGRRTRQLVRREGTPAAPPRPRARPRGARRASGPERPRRPQRKIVKDFALPVIPLMVTGGVCLAFTFVVFFLAERLHREANPERDSLLPLGEENLRAARTTGSSATSLHDHHDDHGHSHAPGGCGCKSGRTAPCPGCLKSRATTKS